VAVLNFSGKPVANYGTDPPGGDLFKTLIGAWKPCRVDKNKYASSQKNKADADLHPYLYFLLDVYNDSSRGVSLRYDFLGRHALAF
jgi:hypothetical protein